jgi:hypothetical protein
VHLTLSEYIVERLPNRALHRADVYHKLKHPSRFDFLRDRPHLLQPATPTHEQPTTAPPRCDPMPKKYRVRRGGQLVARLDHCCANWMWCDLSRKDWMRGGGRRGRSGGG